MKLEDLAAPLDMTPVSVQNVKRIMPAWNKKFEDWGEQVEESIEKRISLEIEKIDPSMLASVRIDRRITGKSLSDGTYYPGQLLEVENAVRIVRIFDTPVTIYSPGDKETFIPASIEGVTFDGNKVTVPTNPRIEYFKFTSYIQLSSDITNLGKTLEYELVAYTTHSIDVGSVFVPITPTLAPPGAVQDLDFGLFIGAANMAAKYPQEFMNWAKNGEEVAIQMTGLGDVVFRIVAVQQYDTTAGGKCGLVLQSKTLFTEFTTDENTNLSLFPANWQAAIVQCLVPMLSGSSSSGATIPAITTTAAKVFRPSRAEIAGKIHTGEGHTNGCYDDVGSQYPYWANHNTASDRIMKTLAGEPHSYVLRQRTSSMKRSSALWDYYSEYGEVSTEGEFTTDASTELMGLYRPLCFCIGDSTV